MMNYFKRTLLAASLPFVFQASANAAVIDLGTLAPTVLEPFSVNFSGDVNDTYTFATLSPFAFTSSVTAGGPGVDSLFTTLTGPSFFNIGSNSTVLGGAALQSIMVNSFLNPGAYSFGVGVGTSGTTPTGTYFGNLTIANTSAPIAAVPEPQTYAMFLAGLGLLGFAKRRKG